MQELEADGGIPRSMSTVSEILIQDLGMKRVVAKFVPQLLLPEQKQYCAAVANELIQMIQTATNEHGFLKKVITRDESSTTIYDQETKARCPNASYLVSTPEEGEAKSQQDQNHVNCVL